MILQENKDPRPAILRGWIGAFLLSFMIALIAALATLYAVSCTAGIHQTAFVYQLSLNVLDLSTTLAPYSIIPTLLAVGVKLWFGAAADTLKMLQPYISLMKSPTTAPDSLLAEYVNTPISLASAKALKHSHWMLALVGLGAFATEVCK